MNCNMSLIRLCAAWRNVRRSVPEWPSWSTAGSAAWAVCNTSKTGGETKRARVPLVWILNGALQRLTNTALSGLVMATPSSCGWLDQIQISEQWWISLSGSSPAARWKRSTATCCSTSCPPPSPLLHESSPCCLRTRRPSASRTTPFPRQLWTK